MSSGINQTVSLSDICFFIVKKNRSSKNLTNPEESQKICLEIEEQIETSEYTRLATGSALPSLTHLSFLDVFLACEQGRRIFAFARDENDQHGDFLDGLVSLCWPGGMPKDRFFVQYVDNEAGVRRYLVVVHSTGRAIAILTSLFLPEIYRHLIEYVEGLLEKGFFSKIRTIMVWYSSVQLRTISFRNRKKKSIRTISITPTPNAPPISVPVQALMVGTNSIIDKVIEWGFPTLRSHIPPDILVDTLVVILLSRPLIITGKDPEIVSRICSTFPAILSPLPFKETHILILPPARYPMLSSPAPYIMGITAEPTSDFLLKHEIDTTYTVSILNIDNGKLSTPSDIPCLPHRDEIVHKLEKIKSDRASLEELRNHFSKILVLECIDVHSIGYINRDGIRFSVLFKDSYLEAVPDKSFAQAVINESNGFAAYKEQHLENIDVANKVARSNSRDFCIRSQIWE